MALKANALVSLATVKDHLDIPVGNTDQDSRLERMIDSASNLIERYVDRSLVKQSYTERQNGTGTKTLMLRNYPADKPTSLHIGENGVFEATHLIDTADYSLFGTDEIVLHTGLFTRGTNNIKIIYEAGFSPMESDLENACIELVEFLYERKSDRRVGLKAKSKNGETISFVQGIPEFIANELEPYVRFEFANSNNAVTGY